MIVQGTSVGLDVHALSVVAHAIDEETGKIARARLCPDHGEVLGWLHQLRARCGWRSSICMVHNIFEIKQAFTLAGPDRLFDPIEHHRGRHCRCDWPAQSCARRRR